MRNAASSVGKLIILWIFVIILCGWIADSWDYWCWQALWGRWNDFNWVSFSRRMKYTARKGNRTDLLMINYFHFWYPCSRCECYCMHSHAHVRLGPGIWLARSIIRSKLDISFSSKSWVELFIYSWLSRPYSWVLQIERRNMVAIVTKLCGFKF